MEKYFTLLKKLMEFIALKEKEIANLKQNLSQIKREENENYITIAQINAKLSGKGLNDEESEEILKCKLIHGAFFGILILLAYLLITTYGLGFYLLSIVLPCLVSIPIGKKIRNNIRKKYKALKAEHKKYLADEEKTRDDLRTRQQELIVQEKSTVEEIKSEESILSAKKAELKKLNDRLISELAPILDDLIAREINEGNNLELKEILERIREI